jgi:hypothetical protein
MHPLWPVQPQSSQKQVFRAEYLFTFMRRFLLVLVCLLPALAGAADRFNLARVLVSGSQRYREDDLVRATGLTVNTLVTADDLQNAATRLGNRWRVRLCPVPLQACYRHKRYRSRLPGGGRRKVSSRHV